MFSKSNQEMLSFKSFVDDIINRQEGPRNITFQYLVRDPEKIFIIKYIQIFKYGVVSQLVAGKTYKLIKNRQGIAHGSICLLGNNMQGIVFGSNIFHVGHMMKMPGNIINGNPLEIKNLAAGEDGWKDLMLFGGG